MLVSILACRSARTWGAARTWASRSLRSRLETGVQGPRHWFYLSWSDEFGAAHLQVCHSCHFLQRIFEQDVRRDEGYIISSYWPRYEPRLHVLVSPPVEVHRDTDVVKRRRGEKRVEAEEEQMSPSSIWGWVYSREKCLEFVFANLM